MRVDVWLWRARLCKTRSLASAKAEEGRIRRTRAGEMVRIDKASRTVRIGDELAFAIASRAFALRAWSGSNSAAGLLEEATVPYVDIRGSLEAAMELGCH